MIKKLKLAFLFLIAGALVSISWPLNPPADAGGTDIEPKLSLDPVATARGTDTSVVRLADSKEPPYVTQR
jgi:hypothetical protein